MRAIADVLKNNEKFERDLFELFGKILKIEDFKNMKTYVNEMFYFIMKHDLMKRIGESKMLSQKKKHRAFV